MLKRTAKARNAVTVTSAPRTRNAVGHGTAPRKRNPAATAPALPPAPTMPATEPSAFRLMNGTTEKVAPSDICTNRLKTTRAGTASASTGIWEKSISASPSAKRATKSQRTRPDSPQRRPHRSPRAPPRVRAKTFIRPKSIAAAPAHCTARTALIDEKKSK